MRNLILSLDIGTTVAKGVLFDLSGRELAIAEQGLRLLTPRPDWVEMVPQEIWEAVQRVVRSLTKEFDLADYILAVALSTQGGSMVPVKGDGSPAYNLITWLDRRSQGMVENWQQEGIDKVVRRTSGWSPTAGLPLASIAALRQMNPDVFDATARFLSINDYLTWKLTGIYATNPSMAGEMLLTNIRTGAWSEDLCRLVGIRDDQLSAIFPSGTVIGEIQPQVARQIGLPPGTPLINGGQDHSCEALALGLIDAGEFWLASGTAWVINGVSAIADIANLPATMSLNFHVLPGRWTMSQFLGGLGAGMEWLLANCWKDAVGTQSPTRQQQLQSLNNALNETKPGSAGLLAFPISGANHEDVVMPGGFCGLRLDHTVADMGRAVMEGAAFELRWALDDLQQAGFSVDQLWMVGGAVHSPHWPQILADVSGIPVFLCQYHHGPALGAAMLALKGLGLVDEFPDWVSARKVDVNRDHGSLYKERFSVYQQVALGKMG